MIATLWLEEVTIEYYFKRLAIRDSEYYIGFPQDELYLFISTKSVETLPW